jgi:SNF2-related domain/Helicase conserved C-terminal domain
MPIARNRPPRLEKPGHLLLRQTAPQTAKRIDARKRAYVLEVPFSHRGVASSAGARWDKAAKAHIFHGDELPATLTPYAAPPYSWEKLQEDELNGVEAITPSVPQKSVILRSHQEEAVAVFKRAVAARRSTFLNADDVGLGKTIEAWKSILEALPDAQTVLIVCPLSAVAHWRRTIAWMGDGGRRIVVINYDRLKRLFDVPEKLLSKSRGRRKARKVRTQKGAARYGEPYEFDAIIWDESHKLRNLETARSKFALKLNAEADFIMWLSATAGQTPLELAYLAPLLSETTGSKLKDLAEFEEWCIAQGIGVSRGAFGKWEWRGNSTDPLKKAMAEADLELMHQLLFGGAVPAGLRRSPTDIAGWPAINRILLPVVLDAEDRVNYELAWSEFRAAVSLERRGGQDSVNPLVARLRFRQKASLLRTSATLDLVEDLLEQGQRVAISVAFKETLQILKEAIEKAGYRVCTIDGSLTGPQKELQRLDFQYGRADVCIYTVEEAISLHEGEFIDHDAKRSNVIHDLRWSAIQMKQIEGRTHRDGKFSQTYWMLGEGTVEEELAEIVATRLRSMSKMHGDAETVADIEGLLQRLAA